MEISRNTSLAGANMGGLKDKDWCVEDGCNVGWQDTAIICKKSDNIE